MTNLTTTSMPVDTFVKESERIFKLASFLSDSDIIPTHFRGKKANCFLALEMSNRLNVNFFELVNGLYVVHGSPGFTGAFTISLINRSGMFPGGLNFKIEGSGENMQCTCSAKKKDGTHCEATVSMAMAKAEGWTKNKKYQTMPEQMLTYRSATFFCRRYCPEILMGARTIDELEDIKASKEPAQVVPETINMIKGKAPSEDILGQLEFAMSSANAAGIKQSTIDDIYEKVDLNNEDSVIEATEFLLDIAAQEGENAHA